MMDFTFTQVLLGAGLLGLILWFTSSSFRYAFKFTSFYFFILFIATASCFWGIFRPKSTWNAKPIVAFVRNLRWLYGIEMEFRGKENLASNKPFVVVANHQSALDMMCMSMAWPSRCAAIVKSEAKYMATFGLSAYLCGTVFVNRLNRQKSRAVMDRTAKSIKDRGIQVWVFPEGTRSNQREMLPFKKGAFHLAVEAEIPVVPVVISCYENFIDKSVPSFDTGKIIIQALPPISTVGKTHEEVDKFSKDVRDLMIDCYNEISDELVPPKTAVNNHKNH